MRSRPAKIYFIFPLLALIMGFFAIKLNAYKHEVTALTLLGGRISFSDDPQEYYLKTLQNASDPEKDWRLKEKFGTANQPLIAAKSAVMVDIGTGRVLYEKNSTQKMPIASLTKIMTAIVALEHKNIDEKIYVTRHAAYVGEDTMYLTTGEVYTLKELLYGLMLNSGNDAAYAIADGVAGDSDTFVSWMNIKAKELGMENTEFKDPSGLDDTTYSTTEDLVKLSRYAMKNLSFRDIVKTYSIELEEGEHKYLYLENSTNLLTSYPGVAGIKTGYTEEAGLCLVTYANNEGREVIGVILNSIDRKGDMILMLDHAFGTLGVDVRHNLL